MGCIKQIWINLFGPIWLKECSSGNWKKFRDRQLAAVEKINDEDVLKAVALNDGDENVREAGAEKIDELELRISVLYNTRKLKTTDARDAIDSLKRIYAKTKSEGLMSDIRSLQGYYMNTDHTDMLNYDWTYHDDDGTSLCNHFDLSK